MQSSDVPTEELETSKGQIAGALALLCILVVGVITPASLMVWRDNARSAAIRMADVGTFIAAEVSPAGFLTPTLTTVQTTAGSFTVMGTFSALRGQLVAIEDLNKSGIQLCVASTPASCVPMAGAWTGELRRTPQAAHVFNFYSHGLTIANLTVWLAMGILVFLVGSVAFSINIARDERRGENTATAPK